MQTFAITETSTLVAQPTNTFIPDHYNKYTLFKRVSCEGEDAAVFIYLFEALPPDCEGNRNDLTLVVP